MSADIHFRLHTATTTSSNTTGRPVSQLVFSYLDCGGWTVRKSTWKHKSKGDKHRICVRHTFHPVEIISFLTEITRLKLFFFTTRMIHKYRHVSGRRNIALTLSCCGTNQTWWSFCIICWGILLETSLKVHERQTKSKNGTSVTGHGCLSCNVQGNQSPAVVPGA